jgi:hypothetical protein
MRCWPRIVSACDRGDYAPVYARWDVRSHAIITRAQYWLVDYEIGGCSDG